MNVKFYFECVGDALTFCSDKGLPYAAIQTFKFRNGQRAEVSAPADMAAAIRSCA